MAISVGVVVGFTVEIMFAHVRKSSVIIIHNKQIYMDGNALSQWYYDACIRREKKPSYYKQSQLKQQSHTKKKSKRVNRRDPPFVCVVC